MARETKNAKIARLQDENEKLIKELYRLKDEKNFVKLEEYKVLKIISDTYKEKSERLEKALNENTLKQENEKLKEILSTKNNADEIKKLKDKIKELEQLNARVGRKKTISDLERKKIKELYSIGDVSMQELANKYLVSKTAIYKILKKEKQTNKS